MERKIVKFKDLKKSDLIIDAIYEGGTRKNASDDPISKMFGTGNMGGFRKIGTTSPFNLSLVVLYSSLSDIEWPDSLDELTGQFIYYGDNKKPGHDIHDTRQKGNIVLRESFQVLHNEQREKTPPFFICTKGTKGRDVIYKGLAVPGLENKGGVEDLVAIWKSSKGQRFQNYRAIFTVLDIPVVSRAWIEDIQNGSPLGKNCPDVWREWVHSGQVDALKASKIREYRTKEEQLPSDKAGKDIINTIYKYFKDGYAFEKCAGELIQMMDSNIIECDLTRPWVDGGRDACGKYRVGNSNNFISVDFAMEAKRYLMSKPVGVKGTSRLISRLRYRQFGIVVTTSYVGRQAYQEIKEDQHPVVIICGKDIVDILKDNGYGTKNQVKRWLKKFPPKI